MIRAAKLSKLKRFLRSQNHPSRTIDAAIKKACEIPFEVWHAEKNIRNPTFPFASAFSPGSSKIFPTMTNAIEYNDKWQIKCCVYQDEYIVQAGTLL